MASQRTAGATDPAGGQKHTPDARVHIDLYDAEGWDRTIALEQVEVGQLQEQQLLWVDIEGDDPALIERLAAQMQLPADVVALLNSPGSAPLLRNFGSCFYVGAVAVRHEGGLLFGSLVLALVVGTNFVLSRHREPVPFLEELRERERGETDLGMLEAESFAASLLDWHLSTYFEAVSDFEAEVERLEVAILSGSGVQPLEDLQKLRRVASRLRRMLAPHRAVFAALARPDFRPRQERAASHFATLDSHYERAMDMVEGARDLVVGSFELFASHTAWRTNEVVRTLTFFTVLLGVLAVIAGVLGMNFDAPFFRTAAHGFWSAVAGLGAVAILALMLARLRRWL